MKNQECFIKVVFVDLDGVQQTEVIQHNGESDCWFGVIIEDGETEKAFDFNTFITDSYDEQTKGEGDETLYINAYQCTNKVNGVWTNDYFIELEVISFDLVPNSEIKFTLN